MQETKEEQKQATDWRERAVLQAYCRARQWKEDLEALKTKAEKQLEDATNAIVNYLDDAGKKSTGKYDDLGSVTVKAPTPRPKFDEANRELMYQFIRENGGEACIKSAIHPSTFSSFVREKIENGIQIPEFIQIFYQPSVMYSKPKE